MEQTDNTVPLIGVFAERATNKDLAKRAGEKAVTDRVSIDKLREQIGKLSTIIEDLQTSKANGFYLDEVKIIAEITASGELGFIVAGASVEAKGAIELTFKRPTE